MKVTSEVVVAPSSSVADTCPSHVPATGGVQENEPSAPPGELKPGGGRDQVILVTRPSRSLTDRRASSRSPTVHTKESTWRSGGRFGGCVDVVGAVGPTERPNPVPPSSGQPVAATEITASAAVAGSTKRPRDTPVRRPFVFPPTRANLIADKIGLELPVTRPPTKGGHSSMTVQLGDVAPDFTADTTEGTINFHEWKDGSWAVLFSHPKDFTPVCTTELGYTAKLQSEFAARNVKVIGLSCDSVEDHRVWSQDILDTQGISPNFPMIGDPDASVANLYGMIHPNASDTMTVRSVFVIGPDNLVKLMITYPASTGRNFDEVLRVIDSLQLTAHHKVATPVNWQHGEDVIIVPALSNSEAAERFPGGWDEQKPYLRVVAQPTG